MKFNPLSPIEVSGSFTLPDDQVTQIFGDTSDIVQKFTLTIPLPTNCIVRNGSMNPGLNVQGNGLRECYACNYCRFSLL